MMNGMQLTRRVLSIAVHRIRAFKDALRVPFPSLFCLENDDLS